MKKILSVIAALTISASFTIFAKDMKKAEYTLTPAMHCEKCEAKIKTRLKFEKGVSKIDANAKRGTLIVDFDADKTSADKIGKSLEKIGYKAKITKIESQQK